MFITWIEFIVIHFQLDIAIVFSNFLNFTTNQLFEIRNRNFGLREARLAFRAIAKRINRNPTTLMGYCQSWFDNAAKSKKTRHRTLEGYKWSLITMSLRPLETDNIEMWNGIRSSVLINLDSSWVHMMTEEGLDDVGRFWW